jgi:hypothetical protein
MQSGGLKGRQEVLDVLGRVLEALPLKTGSGAEVVCGRIEEIRQETIWMENFDLISSEQLRRKIGEVVRDDGLRFALDRCGQDVTIVRVGKSQRDDQVAVLGHQSVADGNVHQLSSSFQPISADVWIIAQDTQHPFIVDIRSPARPQEVDLCQSDHQVANWS